ncbi:MAG TPA: crotonase/enoyl-CoA hydratase family protein [Kutzneria sp.]|nr:crotonase/enoyl-CoA hydratase family protein [Kutzneria sp.]
MSDEVLTEYADGVAVITINRPSARNAVDRAVAEGLAAAVDELDRREDLVVGIVTGAGGTFCAGMDLKAFVRGEFPTVEGRGFGGITQQPPVKPLIAAVEGYALAGGLEIALSCDLIVASSEAKFGIPEVKRGLVAAGGGVLRLPSRLPYHVAMELALTGGFLDAARAHHFGFVNRLSAAGEALAVARSLAAEIAANGPLAVRATKQVIVESRDWAAAEAFSRQEAITGPVFASSDAREGAQAFAEKRGPRWTGR